jgi:hypothetical protein
MLEGIGIELGNVAEQLLASDAAVTAKLHWREVLKPTLFDLNDESSMREAVYERKMMEFRALKHQVDHRLSGFQRFMEVQTGDVILDYTADLDLAGKDDVRIEVGGLVYTQKNASAALLEAWDVETGNGGTMKSILLTPAG